MTSPLAPKGQLALAVTSQSLPQSRIPQIQGVNRLQRLRYLLNAFEPMPDAPRMETPVRPLVNPPTFEEMWATVQRRKP